jgi:predicted P-loop ATPase/GTPase
MAEYLSLLKLNAGKIVSVVDALRKLPDKPSSGVNLHYTMNIFGAWDVGIWLSAENTMRAAEFASKDLKEIPGVTDIYTVPTFPHGLSAQSNGTVEYLSLLKLNAGKIVDAMNALRKLPDKPSSGVNPRYTMNIFGVWDVGIWFSAENTMRAAEFVYKKIKEIPGVTDIYTVPTFPHGMSAPSTSQRLEEEDPKKTEKAPIPISPVT